MQRGRLTTENGGFRPGQFCLDGLSDAGVDYYDAASVRCTNGATLAISGSATNCSHIGPKFEKNELKVPSLPAEVR